MEKKHILIFLAGIVASTLILSDPCIAQITPKKGAGEAAVQRTPPMAVTKPPTPGPSSDEYVQETWERSSETLKGLYIVEKFQKGVGRNITLTVNCPTDGLVISGGGENTGMPVFHLMQSFPMGGWGWRVVFARDMSPLNPGQTGVVDLHPPSPYQITVTAYCVNRTVWNKVMNSVQ